THFKRDIIIIYPGELYASKTSEMVSTVLGSCVSVALFDEKNKVGGLNHFMLAKNSKTTNDTCPLLSKFGEYAIPMLIEELIKKGANKANLTAKVFGGSNVFNVAQGENDSKQVGINNINFAFSFLEQEHIPIISSDIGGIVPRKIFFDCGTSKLWLKRLKNNVSAVQQILKEEEKFFETFVSPFKPLP
ncbi:MAG: chemotaxis protein CheD, partial [Treponema sp.]|nr:chemotaxis protein CheD [Treponema sp.]